MTTSRRWNLPGVAAARAAPRVRAWAAALLLGALACSPGTALAGLSFTIDGANNEFSGSGNTFSGVIVVTFDDTGADEVTMTIDTTGMTGPVGAKLTQLNFNIAGITPSTVNFANGSPFDAGSVTVSKNDNGASGPTNPFKADGDGFFDFALEFPNSGNTFTINEKVTLILTSSGLTSAAFNDISVGGGDPNKTGFYLAAHLQAISGGGSGWFNGDPTPAVPEPSTLISGGLAALAGLGLAWRRRRATVAA